MPTTSELRNNDALPAGDAIEAADGVPMYDASLDKTVSVPGDRFAAVDVLESGSEVLEDAKAIDFDGSQFDVAKNGSGVEVSIASTFDTGVNSFQNRTGEVVLQTEDVGDGLAIDTTPSPNQIRVPDGAIGVAKLSTLTGNIGFDESGPTERGVEFLETTPNIRWLRAPSSGRALEVVDASAGDDLLWLDEDGNLRVTGEVEAFADGSGTSPDSPNSELQVLDDGTSLTMDAQSIDFQGGTVNQNGDEITVDVNAGTDFQAGDNLAFDTSTDPKTLDVTGSFYTDADAVDAVNAETSLSVDIGGDADTVDGYEGSDLGVLSEDETVTGQWSFTSTLTIADNVQIRDDSGDRRLEWDQGFTSLYIHDSDQKVTINDDPNDRNVFEATSSKVSISPGGVSDGDAYFSIAGHRNLSFVRRGSQASSAAISIESTANNTLQFTDQNGDFLLRLNVSGDTANIQGELLMGGTIDLQSNGNLNSVNDLNVSSISSNNGNSAINVNQPVNFDTSSGGNEGYVVKVDGKADFSDGSVIVPVV